MNARVADIIEMMEVIAPACLAEEWDNAGLQVGHEKWPVEKVWIALDPTKEVIDKACKHNVDLLITHHPLIFSSFKSVNFETNTGQIIYNAAINKLSVFSSHTNLDSASHGINDILSEKIGLTDLEVLSKKNHLTEDTEKIEGIGRVGNLNKKKSLNELALFLKKKLNLDTIRITGNPDLEIKKVAVCSGSGGSLIKDFFSSGATVYITGDIKFHEARMIEDAGLGLIDIGHFASEHIFIEKLKKMLIKSAEKRGLKIDITACDIEKDPFLYM